MADAVSSADFKERGFVHESDARSDFSSKELANKYAQSPPPELDWYRGPELFSHQSRGSWRQAYIEFSRRCYTPSGRQIEPPDPLTARMPSRDFQFADLMRPENKDYFLASPERFFELFGTKAFDALADRHWLEMRRVGFESVERHWPTLSIEKDLATEVGTFFLARGSQGQGYLNLNDAGMMRLIVPQYLWRNVQGRPLSEVEVINRANHIHYDVAQGYFKKPFDHTFARQLIDHVVGPDGDLAQDRVQFRFDGDRTLDSLLKSGLRLQVHPKYVPLLQDIAQKQSQGQIPRGFSQSSGDDGLVTYIPDYRTATAEETTIPLSELVKNLKIVDYGFKNAGGKVLGKISLASHDVHDHARAFWLLEKEGLFTEAGVDRPSYPGLMGSLTDPLKTGIFKREGELVASVAYDWRSYFDLPPASNPPLALAEIRTHFLNADSRGQPLSKNQAAALSYVEQLLEVDPEGISEPARKLRHIVGGVWSEFLEQKRKTEAALFPRLDGTYQRLSMTNPEYLAFVIDAARVMERNGPQLLHALTENNLQIERYLQDLATLPDEDSVPQLRFSPADIIKPEGAGDGVPAATREWLVRHPGFNTRRAPIRDWLIRPFAPENTYAGSDEERRDFRNLMYGP